MQQIPQFGSTKDSKKRALALGVPEIAKYVENRKEVDIETARTAVFRKDSETGEVQVYLQVKQNGLVEFSGGKIEESEPVYIGAIEELIEETGINIDRDKVKYGSDSSFRKNCLGDYVYENPKNNKKTRVTVYCMIATQEQSEQMNSDSALAEDKLEACSWVSLSDFMEAENSGRILIDGKEFEISGNTKLPKSMLEQLQNFAQNNTAV